MGVSLQAVDSDGHARRTLGGNVKAPAHLVSASGSDPIVLEACFVAADPLFYLELRNEEQFYLSGHWWMDVPKYSESNEICSLVPIRVQDCLKQMEQSQGGTFKGHAHCEHVRNSTTQLLDVSFEAVEKKFKTKMSKVHLAIPRKIWLEHKDYRVRMWKASKNWSAQEKDDDEKKDGEK